jgi:hypothetical protein
MDNEQKIIYCINEINVTLLKFFINNSIVQVLNQR